MGIQLVIQGVAPNQKENHMELLKPLKKIPKAVRKVSEEAAITRYARRTRSDDG